jgi:hypothetical protein
MIANSGMYGQSLSIAVDGTATLGANGMQGPRSAAQAAAAENLSEVIDNPVTTKIVLSDSSNVVVGSYTRSAIDLGDMAQLGTGPGPTMAGAFNHEVREQFLKQVKGTPDPAGSQPGFGAHVLATETEEKVIGWSIGPPHPVIMPSDRRRAFLDPTRVSTTYTSGTKTLKVFTDWQNYNLTGVERVP